MPEFSYADWLRSLLNHGEATFESPPELPEDDSEERAILRAAHATACLHLPGPTLPFAEKVVQNAARLTLWSCWHYLYPPDDADSPIGLSDLGKPKRPEDHLAADLSLRYLVAVHRRSQLRGTDNPLAIALGKLFCDWPLTGVLADLKEPPTGDLNFGDSATLQMLYAERLVRIPQAAWVPPSGLARQRAELVFQRMGKVLPVRKPEKSTDD